MSKNTDKWIGKQFDKLKVISCEKTTPPKYYVYFNCLCECGKIVNINKDVILRRDRNHELNSCGCSHITRGLKNKGYRRSENAESKIGEIYNRLTIIDIIHQNIGGYKMVCECECGKITKQQYANLVNNKVMSCGCYGKEKQSITGSKVGLNNCTKQCSKYKWHYMKNHIRINMRSGYEVMFAMILDKENIEWLYEPKCFKLSNGKRYTPDFYLPKENRYIDTKGRYMESSKTKIKEFEMLGNKIDVIFIKEIEERLGLSYYKFKKNWKIKYNIN